MDTTSNDERNKEERRIIDRDKKLTDVEREKIDPWKHRSSGMKCATCMWFAPKTPDNIHASVNIGRCRRHSPSMNGYPVVFIEDWCGDHKLNENT